MPTTVAGDRLLENHARFRHGAITVAALEAFRAPPIGTEGILTYMDRAATSALAWDIALFARPAFNAQSIEAGNRAFASVSARSSSHFLFSSSRITARFLASGTDFMDRRFGPP